MATLLLLVLAAVSAFAVSSTDSEEAEMEAFIQELLSAQEEKKGAKVGKIIIKEDKEASKEDELQSALDQMDDDDQAVLQEIVALKQNPAARAQIWGLIKKWFGKK